MRALPLLLVAGATVSAPAAVLFDQIGTNATTSLGVFSQDLETAYDQFDITAIDDFTLTQPATLTSVEAVVLGYFLPNGGSVPALAQSWQVAIFSAAAGPTSTTRVGDVFNAVGLPATSSSIPGPTANYDLVNISLTASNVTLPAGSYWLGITARMDTTYGTAAIGNSATSDGVPLNARQINPGMAYVPTTNAQYTPPSNLSYRINGIAPVPEPASLAALGLGAATLLRRRRAR